MYAQIYQKRNYCKINNHITRIAPQEEVILLDLNYITEKR